MGITKLEANEKGGRITFSSKTTVSPLLLVMLVQNKPQHYKMADATRLRFFEASESVEERFKVVEEIISLLEKSELQAA